MENSFVIQYLPIGEKEWCNFESAFGADGFYSYERACQLLDEWNALYVNKLVHVYKNKELRALKGVSGWRVVEKIGNEYFPLKKNLEV